VTDSRLSWLALKTVPQIGTKRYLKLLECFGDPQRAIDASVSELKRVSKLRVNFSEPLKNKVDWKFAEEQLAKLDSSDAKLITYNDSCYPENLKRIDEPPPFLFIMGDIQDLDEKAVAMVGSRLCTEYGKQVTEQLSRSLAESGFTIVSGLARGIDSIAHRTTIKAGGRTLAVLGCGLNIYYPPENKGLYQEITKSGAVISEFFFDQKPEKHNFPHRNRIISGLSKGVVVIEAGKSSGTLSTTSHALQQNREVFAVPGSINSPASSGANELIKQGAIPVTAVSDILLALGYDPQKKKQVVPKMLELLPKEQLLVYNSLTERPQQVDFISSGLGIPVSEILTTLLNLEMNGLVRQLPGMLFLKEL